MQSLEAPLGDPNATSRKHVYIAYTGGTIGMCRGTHGYRPKAGFLEEQMATIRVLQDPAMPRYTVREFDPLLDSSNMTPREWMAIGEDIAENYDAFDGFIVLHGTDTMAYSASALSFMLENLGKPIIFTGSQIPLVEIRNDARDNLITSLLLAAEAPLPEVCLFAGNRLLRGNRATKTSATRFRAFRSPNALPLGDIGVDLAIHAGRALPVPSAPPVLHRVGPARAGRGEGAESAWDGVQVADIRLFPGITPTLLEQFLSPPLQGAILHTYGLGNAPQDPAFLRPIREAVDRGVVVVNCTQCLEGTVDMNGYATGQALQEAGVASGWDMTAEAALTKLYWLLSLDLPHDEVRRLMELNLRGELSRPLASVDLCHLSPRDTRLAP